MAEMYTSKQNYMINVTEVRGTPLIVLNAYEAFIFLFGFFMLKILLWVFKPMCNNKKNIPTLEATPVNTWLNNILNTTPTSRSSHSTFEPSDDSDEENEDIELATRRNVGRVSDT